MAASRDLDRGRASREQVETQIGRDLTDLVDLQRQAGLDRFSDGMLQWQDLFRPIVESCSGLKAGPMLRWFDNNAFFRAPEVTDGEPLAWNGLLPPAYETALCLPTPRVATLPSPLLFSRVALARGDRNALMRELAVHVLRPLAERLVREGYGLIQLQEPWLTFHGIEKSEWTQFEESLRAITEGLGAETILHTYFGDAARWADRLRELPVSAVGIDFLETDVEALGSNWKVGVLAGCLDGRNSLVESSDAIVEFVRRLAGGLAPPAIHLSSNCDLEFLPWTVAREKVMRLGEAACRLKELHP